MPAEPNPAPTPDPRLEGLPVLPVHLSITNPPASMPEVGSHDYELLLSETGGESSNEGFDYETYIADRSELFELIEAAESFHAAAMALPSPYPDPPREIAPVPPPEPPDPTPEPEPEPPEQIRPIFPDQPVQFEDFDPNGNIIESIYLEKPPEIKPIAGTQDYELLLIETDGAAADPEFDYKSHIAATRQPKDYPDWIDPVEDIDPRWLDPDKIGVVKTFEKDFDDYQFYKREDGSIEIKTDDGFDDITGIPKLEFADDTKISAIAHIEATFDQVTGKEDHTGQMFRLYNAAFARFPDADGLEYWIDKNGSGENSKREVAQSFLASDEFSDKYGDNVSTEDYVKTLYNNILGRTPDPEGYNYWVGQLSSGNETRAEALLGFAESAENKALFSDMTGVV